MPVTVTNPKAREKLTRARSKLLLDAPWFGALALRLRLEEAPWYTGLMATDGTRIVYNPTHVLELSDEEAKTIVAHEVSHCALLHVFRVGSRDKKLWNEACDHVTNLLLEKNNFRFPTGTWAPSFRDPRFAGMPVEQVYAIRRAELGDEPQGGQGPEQGDGQGSGDGNGSDLLPPPTSTPGRGTEQPESDGGQEGAEKPGGPDSRPNSPPSPSTGTPPPMSETDWEIAAQQATMVAQKAGTCPADVDRLVRDAHEAKTDWRGILRRFVDETVPRDYSWMTPNRRHAAHGLYLPGLTKENVARIVVAVDTSGSVTPDLLRAFAAELTAILHEAQPAAVDVVYCDARVQGSETFTPDDPCVELHAKGGGGTAFTPVFEWVKNRVESEGEEPPAALVYLTDLESYDTPTEPPYPVLWATGMQTRREAPFGELVRVDLDL